MTKVFSIGSSKVADICGCGRYTPLAMYYIISHDYDTVPIEANENMEHGKKCEPLILKRAQEILNVEISSCPKISDPRFKGISVSIPDGIIKNSCDEIESVVEIKTIMGEMPTDPPLHYAIQLFDEMMCTDRVIDQGEKGSVIQTIAHSGYLILGIYDNKENPELSKDPQIKIFKFERDEDFIEKIVSRKFNMIHWLINKTPPPPEFYIGRSMKLPEYSEILDIDLNIDFDIDF